jgi:hypothetical protein
MLVAPAASGRPTWTRTFSGNSYGGTKWPGRRAFPQPQTKKPEPWALRCEYCKDTAHFTLSSLDPTWLAQFPYEEDAWIALCNECTIEVLMGKAPYVLKDVLSDDSL